MRYLIILNDQTVYRMEELEDFVWEWFLVGEVSAVIDFKEQKVSDEYPRKWKEVGSFPVLTECGE